MLLIYGFLLKLSMFFEPVIPGTQTTDGFLYKYLLNFLISVFGKFPVVFSIITLVLVLTQAITLNRLVASQKLFQKPNYLTAMTYLLVTSVFTEWNVLSAPLLVNTILIWVWARMSGLYNNQNPKSSLFNIGIGIGLAAFFYPPSIAFSVLIIFGLIVTRPFRLAEWLIALLGIVTPYYFLLSILFLNDKLSAYHFPVITFSLPFFYASYWSFAAIILVLIALFVGFYFVQDNFLRQLVQTRKSWSLTLLYLLVALLIPFINDAHTFSYWILSAVPLSVFIAGAFLYPRAKWFPRLLHWSMVAFVIAFAYFVK